MGLRIKTNVESQIAQRRLGDARKALGENLEKLASGQRINKSADDAAGLAVSETIRARTRGLEQAKRNANDGISYIQVTEGSLNEVTNIVSRMRELASQAASDTVGNTERGFLNKEFQQLRSEVSRIVDSSEFNGTRVLKPESVKPLQIFVGSSNRGNVDGKAPSYAAGKDPDVLTIDLADLGDLNKSLQKLTVDKIAIIPKNAKGMASELGPNGTSDLFNRMDNALNSIASFRASLGSVQSRLNSTITNIEISSENLMAAQSRIRDVDYASETAKMATNRILTQAGVSVLSQANSATDYALQLLRS